MPEGVPKTISFGHGARHLAGAEVATDDVEAVIAMDIAEKGSPPSGFFSRLVTVEAFSIKYNAYVLPDGSIHVGTYMIA